MKAKTKATEYRPNEVCNCNVDETCLMHDEQKQVSKSTKKVKTMAKKCSCGPNEGCYLCDKTPTMSLKDLQTTKKVKTMAKQSKKVDTNATNVAKPLPFPYKVSDLDVVVTMGVGRSRKTPRVTIRLLKKGSYQKTLWEGNATLAEVDSLKNDDGLMAFARAKIGAVLPAEITYTFKNSVQLLGPGNSVKLVIEPEECCFSVQYSYMKLGAKKHTTNGVCVVTYDTDDNDLRSLVERLYTNPSDELAQAFIEAGLNYNDDDCLMGSRSMTRIKTAAAKFLKRNPDSPISSIIAEPNWTKSLVVRYILGRLSDLMDSIGDDGSYSRRLLETAIVPGFIMADDQVRGWLKDGVITDFLKVVIEAFYDGCYSVEVKKNQDLTKLVAKSLSRNLQIKVDDLIVVRRSEDVNTYLHLEDVIDSVNNGRI